MEMLMKWIKCCALLLALASGFAEVRAETVVFDRLHREFDGVDLPYCKARINADGAEKPALVIYLHGGSSKGDDNTAQMQELGIYSIANYLVQQEMSAVMVVPQCPATNSWSGSMLKVLKLLLDFTARTEDVDLNRIYIFGGSMGGTGTWMMINLYTDYFAAAMPCAANPARCSAANVVSTPAYTVMGTADAIMSVATAEQFVDEVCRLGGNVEIDVEEGWTHEVTCTDSYVDSRLEWVFGHSREDASGVIQVIEDESSCRLPWYTLDGMIVERPESKGLYIHNGEIVIVGL